VWRAGRDGDPDPSREQLRLVEERNREIVVNLVASLGGNEDRTSGELRGALDTVRAAAAGLCVLNVVRTDYTWAKSVAAQQSIGLISAAVAEAGFTPAPEEARAALWAGSYARTERISATWRV
jgi:hypothetical protein